MRRVLNFVILFSLVISFVSCKQKGRGLMTPTSSALPYEVLVVIPNDLKQTKAGLLLKEILTSDVPGLPQSESAFKIMETDPAHFDGILKPIRNIIIVDIDKTQYTKASMTSQKDLYAYPQSVLTLKAPDSNSLVDYLELNRVSIVQYFTNAEMNRQMAIYEKNPNNMASGLVREMFGSDVWLSGELKSVKKGENFLWLGTAGGGDVNQYYVMYSVPYVDNDSFTTEYFIHKRDSVMSINIPGESEGMYMMTDADFTEFKPISLRGQYALEARGLWKMKNDFMGGPFVSHMRLDTENKRLVFTEIFVYAPEKMKRNYVRSMEASLYTVRLPQDLKADSQVTLNNGIDEK